MTTTKTAILTAAVLTVVTGVSHAQFRVDRSGSNDANNRVGSSGRNEVDRSPRPWEVNNNLIYGNVTGGKEFRGSLQSFDSQQFRGTTAGVNSDNFVRNSAGVSTGGVTSYNSQQTREFYGDARAVTPPANTVQIPGAGGYVPPRPDSWRTVDPRYGAVNQESSVVFRPSDYNQPGAVDLTYAPNAIAAPGDVRSGELNNLSEYTRLNRVNNDQLTAEQVQTFRAEQSGGNANVGPLNGSIAGQQNRDKQSGTGNEADNGSVGGDAGGSGAIGGARPLSATTIDNSSSTDALPATGLDTALGSDGGSGVELGNQTVFSDAAGKAGGSTVYSNLQQRRAEQTATLRPGQANEQATAEFNKQKRERDQAAKADGKEGEFDPAAGTKTGGGNAGNTAAGKGDDNKSADPVKVESLAGDGKSALDNLLSTAEKAMKEGQFATAAETYEKAERLSPKNALVKLGRAHAEIGGEYFKRAESTLRRALLSDENLLAGQYNLRGFIGESRLEVIERDLSELVKKDASVGPAVLLAYVYYNTSNERRAAALLDLADKRSEGKDQLVTLLKKNWKLPTVQGEENK